ncbi:agmatine deiminase family protein [Spirosoma sp.]|uniref:agmatine deiminase family protein n=1 Tax=Spirosoma sp. TaxID=1899569 RepID=UPI003B3A5454
MFRINVIRSLVTAILLACLSACSTLDDHGPAASTIRVPAEWEEQESVWMAWPSYSNKHDWSAPEVYAELLKSLLPTVKVDLCVADAAMQEEIKAFLLAHGVSNDLITSKLRFHNINYVDIWLRDTGPIFIKDGSTLKSVDFQFNSWGWGPYITDPDFAGYQATDETVDRQISDLMNVPHIGSSLLMEGGALEFNGKGTVIVSEDVVFQRNPTWTKAAVEAEFSRLFNTKKVIWIKGTLGNDAHPVIHAPFAVPFGNATQPVYTLLTTNGHTDEFVRFINSNTVLLAETPSEAEAAQNPIVAKSRELLLNTRYVLDHSTDQDGHPFQIIDFPEVQPLYVDMDSQDEMFNLMSTLDYASVGKPNIDPTGTMKGVLAASYLNFLVINNVVLVAKYAGLSADMATKDQEAVHLLQQAFPGKTVISVDVRAINVGGGGIHCITRQMPK